MLKGIQIWLNAEDTVQKNSVKQPKNTRIQVINISELQKLDQKTNWNVLEWKATQ